MIPSLCILPILFNFTWFIRNTERTLHVIQDQDIMHASNSIKRYPYSFHLSECGRLESCLKFVMVYWYNPIKYLSILRKFPIRRFILALSTFNICSKQQVPLLKTPSLQKPGTIQDLPKMCNWYDSIHLSKRFWSMQNRFWNSLLFHLFIDFHLIKSNQIKIT